MLSALPWRDPSSEIADIADPSAILHVLAVIDELPGSATGALRVASKGAVCGNVLVEGGRICWAAADGWARRLTDILRHQSDPPIERARIEELYVRCRREGLPLGEQLVASGLVTGDGLRRALRQHTVETLLWMTRDGVEATQWTEHARQRYDARFTFGTAEVLGIAGAVAAPDDAERAKRELADVVAGGAHAVAFVRGSHAVPVPVYVTHREVSSAALVVSIGRWAVGALDLTAAIDPERRLVACSAPTGAAAVIWSDADLVLVALCEDASTAAFAMVAHARRRKEDDGDPRP